MEDFMRTAVLKTGEEWKSGNYETSDVVKDLKKVRVLTPRQAEHVLDQLDRRSQINKMVDFILGKTSHAYYELKLWMEKNSLPKTYQTIFPAISGVPAATAPVSAAPVPVASAGGPVAPVTNAVPVPKRTSEHIDEGEASDTNKGKVAAATLLGKGGRPSKKIKLINEVSRSKVPVAKVKGSATSKVASRQPGSPVSRTEPTILLDVDDSLAETQQSESEVLDDEEEEGEEEEDMDTIILPSSDSENKNDEDSELDDGFWEELKSDKLSLTDNGTRQQRFRLHIGRNVCVTAGRYNGSFLFHLRHWRLKNNNFFPSTKGVTFTPENFRNFSKLQVEIEQALHDLDETDELDDTFKIQIDDGVMLEVYPDDGLIDIRHTFMKPTATGAQEMRYTKKGVRLNKNQWARMRALFRNIRELLPKFDDL